MKKVEKILFALREHLNLKNYQELAEYFDLKRTVVYAWIRNENISQKEKILSKLPQISLEWLETGEGPMLAEERSGRTVITNTAVAGDGGVAQTTRKGKNVNQSVFLREDRENLHLSTEEAMIIKLLRKVDRDGNLALEIVEQLLQKR